MSQRSYARNVLISVAAVAVMSAMALANNVVIARTCGPEGRGVYGVAVAIGALALPIASLGLGQATTWQLGRGRSLAQLLGVARKVTLISLALGLVSALAVGSLWDLGWDRAVLAAVLAAGLALPAQVVVDLGRGVALGQGRALAYNLCSAVVIAVLLGLNLVTLRWGPDWVLINLVLAQWLVALVLIGSALRTRALPSDRPLTRDTLRFGVRSAAVALGDAALLRIDYLIAAPIVGLAALGVYAIADQISHLLAWAGLLAGKLMLPEAASDPDGRRSLATLGLACRVLVTLMLAASIVAAALGSWMITLLFGQAFAPAYLGLLVLLPASFAKSLHALISTWLQGRGVQQPIVRASGIAVAVEAMTVVIAGLTLGWLGVALAKSAAYLIQLGLSLRALRAHRREHGLVGDDRGWWLLDGHDLARLRAHLADRRARTQP